MIEYITVMELLSRINKTRKRMDELYTLYLDPDIRESSRSFVSLYNKKSMLNPNGREAHDIEEEITSIDNEIRSTFNILQKLLMIKEQINATCKIKIISPISNTEVELSVAQVLVLKSTGVSKYISEYNNKLRDDYKYAIDVIEEFNKSACSNDKVDRYVLAKINSLHLSTSDKDTYYKFADEYIESNRLELLDPLNVKDRLQEKRTSIEEIYASINLKLLEFNINKKIWIDLEKESDFFGFINQ